MTLRVTFWMSDKPRERILADAFARGVAEGGDHIELRPLQAQIETADCDVACMVGVKSRELCRAHWDKGIHTIILDKGYTRHAAPGAVKLWEYWRVAVDAHHPTGRLMKSLYPRTRWDELELTIKPWRDPTRKGAILLAGSSQKYHDFYGLREPTHWAKKLIRQLREVTDQPIIYRPKPSWRDAVPIEGTIWSGSQETIDEVLERTSVLITHGSNACFEAVLEGIPCVVVGEAVAKPISSKQVEEIAHPWRVAEPVREAWFYELAHYQWTLPEMAAGKTWEFLRPQIYG